MQDNNNTKEEKMRIQIVNQLRERVIIQLVQTNRDSNRTMLSITIVEKCCHITVKCSLAALVCTSEQLKLESQLANQASSYPLSVGVTN